MSDFKVLFDVGLEEGSLATLESQINKIKELGKGTKLFSDIDTGRAISSLKEIESVVKSIEKTKISPKIDTKEIEKLGEAVKEIDKINFSTSLNKLKTDFAKEMNFSPELKKMTEDIEASFEGLGKNIKVEDMSKLTEQLKLAKATAENIKVSPEFNAQIRADIAATEELQSELRKAQALEKFDGGTRSTMIQDMVGMVNEYGQSLTQVESRVSRFKDIMQGVKTLSPEDAEGVKYYTNAIKELGQELEKVKQAEIKQDSFDSGKKSNMVKDLVNVANEYGQALTQVNEHTARYKDIMQGVKSLKFEDTEGIKRYSSMIKELEKDVSNYAKAQEKQDSFDSGRKAIMAQKLEGVTKEYEQVIQKSSEFQQSIEKIKSSIDGLKVGDTAGISKVNTDITELRKNLKDVEKDAQQAFDFNKFDRPKILDDFKNAVAPFETLINSSKELASAQEKLEGKILKVDANDVVAIKEIKSEVSSLIDLLKESSKSEIFEVKTRPALLNQLEKIKEEFKDVSQYSEEFRDQIASLETQANSLRFDDKLGMAQFRQGTIEVEAFGKSLQESASFGDMFTGKLSSMQTQLVGLATRLFGLRAVLSQLRKGFDYVKDVDSSLTEIAMVTNKSIGDVQQWGKEYQTLAKTLSVSNKEMTQGAVGFVRQGLSQAEVLERLSTATMFAKITNTDFDESVELLTATVNGMGVDIERAADVMIHLGDATATSGQEVAKGLSKTAGTASALGVEFEKVASWIAEISARTRDVPESVGSSINMILSRMGRITKQGFDAEDGVAINDVEQALDKANVKLRDSENQFRDFGDVLDDLGERWQGLDRNTQMYIANAIAGARRQSSFLQLMDGYADSVKLYDEALLSSGTTMSKYETYLQSLQAKIDSLKGSMEGLYSTLIQRGSIEAGVGGIQSLIDTLTVLIDKFGVLGVVLGGLSIKGGLSLLTGTLLPAIKNIVTGVSGASSAIAMFGGALSLTVPQLAAIIALLVGVPLLIGKISKSISDASFSGAKADEALDTHRKKISELQKLQERQTALDKLKAKGKDTGEAELALQRELARIAPEVATGIDSQGNAYSTATDKIKGLIEEERTLLELQAASNAKKAEKSMPKYEQQLAYWEQELDRAKEMVSYQKNRMLDGDNVSETSIKIASKNYEEAKTKVQEYTQKVGEAKRVIDIYNNGVQDTVQLEKELAIQRARESVSKDGSIENIQKQKEALMDLGLSGEDAIRAITGSVEELDSVIGNSDMSPEESEIEAWKRLSDAISNAKDRYNMINSAIQEYGENGALSLDTVGEIITKYPELAEHIEQVGDQFVFTEGVIDALNQSIQDNFTVIEEGLQNAKDGITPVLDLTQLEDAMDFIDELKFSLDEFGDYDFESLGMEDFRETFAGLNEDLEESKISVSEYFDLIGESIADMDWGLLSSDQRNELMADIFTQLDMAYDKITGLYADGEIAAGEYISQISSIGRAYEEAYAKGKQLKLVDGQWVDASGQVDQYATSLRNSILEMESCGRVISAVGQNANVVSALMNNLGNEAQTSAIMGSKAWKDFANQFSSAMANMQKNAPNQFNKIVNDIAKDTGIAAETIAQNLTNSSSAMYNNASSFAGALNAVQSSFQGSIGQMAGTMSGNINEVAGMIDGFNHRIDTKVIQSGNKTFHGVANVPDGDGGTKSINFDYSLPEFDMISQGSGSGGSGGSGGGGSGKGGSTSKKKNKGTSQKNNKNNDKNFRSIQDTLNDYSKMGDWLNKGLSDATNKVLDLGDAKDLFNPSPLGLKPPSGGGGGGGKGGGGGGGGGGSGKEEYKAEADRYEKINMLIDKNSNALNRNKTLQDAYKDDTKKRLALMDEEISKNKEKQKLQHINAQMLREERAELEQTLAQSGFVFAGEGDDRMIQNLEAIEGKSQEIEESFKRYLEIQLNALPELSTGWWEVQNEIRKIKLDKMAEHLEFINEQTEYLNRQVIRLDHQIKMLDATPILNADGTVNKLAQTNREFDLMGQKLTVIRANTMLAQGAFQSFETIGLDPVIGKTKEYRDELWKLEQAVMSAEQAELALNQAWDNKVQQMATDWINEQNKLYDEQRKRLSALESVQEEIVKIIKKRGELEKKAMDKRHKEEMEQLKERQKEYQKAYKDEVDAYKKMIQDKLDALKEQWREDDYQEKLAEEEEKLAELKKELNELSLDDTLSSQYKQLKIKEQISDQEKKISKMQKDKERKDTENLLKDKLKEYNDAAKDEMDIMKEKDDYDRELLKEKQEREKQAHEEAYSNASVYAEARKALMDDQVEYAKGSFMSIEGAFQQFSNEFGKGMGIMGEVIQHDFIQKLESAQDAIQQMDYMMSNLRTKYASDYDVFGNGHLTKPQKPDFGGASNMLGSLRPDEFKNWSESDFQNYLARKQAWEIARTQGNTNLENSLRNQNKALRDKYGMGSDRYSYADLIEEIERKRRELERQRRQMAGYKTGGFVPKDGVVMAHEKEMFVPEKYQRDLWEFITDPMSGKNIPNASTIVGTDVNIDINVEGNLDKTVLPDIDRIVQNAIDKSNDRMATKLISNGTKIKRKI